MVSDRYSSETAARTFALTFDDAFLDFATSAWPVLQRYGFNAEVFVPTEYVGKTSLWDAHHGTPAPLLSWSDMRELIRDGVAFGSHGCRHVPLNTLDQWSCAKELAESKFRLENELSIPVTIVAYPYGMHDGNVCRLAAEAGYSVGVTVDFGVCTQASPPLRLPRYQISASLTLEAFQERVAQYLSG